MATQVGTDLDEQDQVVSRRSVHINDLPKELLREIFLFHTSWCRQGWKRFRYKLKRKPYIWMRITFVCKLWRMVVLESPHFWTWIVPTTHPECVKTMLERSQGLPLTVLPSHIGKARMRPPQADIGAMRAILNEIHRCRVLETHLNDDQLPGPSDIVMHAPLMEELDIVHDVCGPIDHDVAHPYIPLHLPHLRRADNSLLHGPGRMFCPSLRTLALDCGYRERLAAPYFLDVLASLPQIEEITIRSDMVLIPPDPTCSGICVSLPRLKSLSLAGLRHIAIWVLTHLDFPHSTRLQSIADEEVGSELPTVDELDSFLSVLSKKVNMCSVPTIGPHVQDSAAPQCISIELTIWFMIVRVWRRSWPLRVISGNTSYNEEFQADLVFWVRKINPGLVAEAVVRNFPLTDIESLSLRSYHWPSLHTTVGQAFARMFHSSTAVHTLYLNTWFVGDVTSFLLHCGVHGIEHEEGFDGPECHFIFPALQYLYLECLEWSVDGEEKRVNLHDEEFQREPLRQDHPLYTMLRRRQLGGAALKQLKVTNRSIVKDEPVDIQLSLDLINGPGTKAYRKNVKRKILWLE